MKNVAFIFIFLSLFTVTALADGDAPGRLSKKEQAELDEAKSYVERTYKVRIADNVIFQINPLYDVYILYVEKVGATYIAPDVLTGEIISTSCSLTTLRAIPNRTFTKCNPKYSYEPRTNVEIAYVNAYKARLIESSLLRH